MASALEDRFTDIIWTDKASVQLEAQRRHSFCKASCLLVVYCQLIRDANKEKRLEWARENVASALEDRFIDVIWTGKASVQPEAHRRHSFHKTGCQPRPKPRLNTFSYLYACTTSRSCKLMHTLNCATVVFLQG